MKILKLSSTFISNFVPKKLPALSKNCSIKETRVEKSNQIISYALITIKMKMKRIKNKFDSLTLTIYHRNKKEIFRRSSNTLYNKKTNYLVMVLFFFILDTKLTKISLTQIEMLATGSH